MSDKDYTPIQTKLKTANVKYNANRLWAHNCAGCGTLTEYRTFEEAATESNEHTHLHQYGPATLWPTREQDQYGVIA